MTDATPSRGASLAQFFGELAALPLFVVYELRPRTDGRAGTDKVPVGPYTEPHPWLAIDCHHAPDRMTLAEAELWAAERGPRYGVGYVLTEDARTFFLDLDHCRTGDSWAPYVGPALGMFPGAFVECSSSGDGVHVLGRYTGPRPLHRTRCADIRAELYTAGRFCALTGAMGSGSILSDHTAALGALITERFPDRGEDANAEWTDGPVPQWRGPADDAALIERAMRSTSARAAFGGAASFADLWHANVDKLAHAFPPQTAGNAYDGSGADLALANHLAYWTGNDCERMARLLKASGLARGKHEREDYLRATILRACAGQDTWYSERVAPAPVAAAPVVADVPLTTSGVPAVPGATLPTAYTVTFDRQGRVESTLANIAHLLREGQAGQIRYDAFTDQIIVSGQPLTDDLITRVRIAFEQQRVAPPSKDTVRDAIERVARDNTYDSAQDWLGSLRWDGVLRIETGMATYFGVDDSPYARSVSAYLWTALAARVLDPGCQADMVPVLVGAQGLRKSSAVAAIAPAPDYFTEVPLNEKDADLARKMRGKVIGEIADMQGLTTRDANAIKAFVTTRHDKWVPKFKEFSTIAARRLVFVGTCNPARFLDDDTGERRWLPLRVERMCDVDALVRDREQLWAEAAAFYRMGGIQWAHAERLSVTEHADYKIDDPWQDAIATWLTDPSHAQFTMADVLGGAIMLAKAHMDRNAQTRAAKVLRRLGCRHERNIVNGVRAWRWVRG